MSGTDLGPRLHGGSSWSHVYLFLVGISWKEKVADLRLKMAERNIVWFVVTALDEIACECSGFRAWALSDLFLGPLGICVFVPFSFLNDEGIYNRQCLQMREQMPGSRKEKASQ